MGYMRNSTLRSFFVNIMIKARKKFKYIFICVNRISYIVYLLPSLLYNNAVRIRISSVLNISGFTLLNLISNQNFVFYIGYLGLNGKLVLNFVKIPFKIYRREID